MIAGILLLLSGDVRNSMVSTATAGPADEWSQGNMGIPDAGAQRNAMIAEMKALRKSVESLEEALEKMEIKVRVVDMPPVVVKE